MSDCPNATVGRHDPSRHVVIAADTSPLCFRSAPQIIFSLKPIDLRCSMLSQNCFTCGDERRTSTKE